MTPSKIKRSIKRLTYIYKAKQALTQNEGECLENEGKVIDSGRFHLILEQNANWKEIKRGRMSFTLERVQLRTVKKKKKLSSKRKHRNSTTSSLQSLFLSLSIPRCLWFCCVVGSACRPGRSPARWLRTEPSWESWLCNPRLRSSAVLHSPRESGPAPGNARSRSMSTTRRPPWTERRQRERDKVVDEQTALTVRPGIN